MQYKIEPIGASFTDKSIKDLESVLDARSQSGYNFHSVFSVQKSNGCLGLGAEQTTYLAVFVKKD